MTRSMTSTSARRLSGERIDDDVHAETGVVDTVESLVLGMVAPLRTVVLVAVEHPDAITAHDRLELRVNQVISPAVQLVARVRRPVRELEERRVQLVSSRNRDELSRRAFDLLGDGLVKRAVDVVVVIIDEEESATVDELAQVVALGLREAHRQVSGQEQKRVPEDVRRQERHHHTGRRHGDRRVARDGVDDVGGHQRGRIPVAGFVLCGGKHELAHREPRQCGSESLAVIAGPNERRKVASSLSALRPLRNTSAACAAASVAAAGMLPSRSIRSRRSESAAAAGSVVDNATTRAKRASAARATPVAGARGSRASGVPFSFPCNRTRSMSTTAREGRLRRYRRSAALARWIASNALYIDGKARSGAPWFNSRLASHMKLYASSSGRLMATTGVSSPSKSRTFPAAAVAAFSAAFSSSSGVSAGRSSWFSCAWPSPWKCSPLGSSPSRAKTRSPTCFRNRDWSRPRTPDSFPKDSRERRARRLTSASVRLINIRWLRTALSASGGAAASTATESNSPALATRMVRVSEAPRAALVSSRRSKATARMWTKSPGFRFSAASDNLPVIVPDAEPSNRLSPVVPDAKVKVSPLPELTMYSKTARPRPMSSRMSAPNANVPCGVARTVSRAGSRITTAGVLSSTGSIAITRECSPACTRNAVGWAVTRQTLPRGTGISPALTSNESAPDTVRRTRLPTSARTTGGFWMDSVRRRVYGGGATWTVTLIAPATLRVDDPIRFASRETAGDSDMDATRRKAAAILAPKGTPSALRVASRVALDQSTVASERSSSGGTPPSMAVTSPYLRPGMCSSIHNETAGTVNPGPRRRRYSAVARTRPASAPIVTAATRPRKGHSNAVVASPRAAPDNALRARTTSASVRAVPATRECSVMLPAPLTPARLSGASTARRCREVQRAP